MHKDNQMVDYIHALEQFVKDPDTSLMALSAVRYAMGRMTSIVSTTCDWITLHWDMIDEKNQKFIERNVNEAIEHYKKTGHGLGMDCDFEKWVKLSEWIKEHIDEKTRINTTY